MLVPAPELSFVPIGTKEEEEWWKQHVVYSKFRRQGIDIVCAAFEHPKAKANVIVITGLFESFLKYNEVIKQMWDRGFSIYTYDHQCQGTSGRWLPEVQDVYVHSFEDYVDDFVHFVTTVSKSGQQPRPTYLLAHSMGGLIASLAMSRDATLIDRAVLSAPMFRMKCTPKCTYAWSLVSGLKVVLPQPIVSGVTWLSCYLGLGAMHPLGWFLESEDDDKKTCIESSCQEQMDKWCKLRKRYPRCMSTCTTNEWVLQSLRAQKKFATRFQFVQTNTLVLQAEHDVFVYNRAMAMFVQKAPNSRMFCVPEAYHELLMETEAVRSGVIKVVVDFFAQKTNAVDEVQPVSPLVPHDPTKPIFSPLETALRLTGFVIGAGGFIVGLSMLLSSSGNKGVMKR
jgi:lysophospholipase